MQRLNGSGNEGNENFGCEKWEGDFQRRGENEDNFPSDLILCDELEVIIQIRLKWVL